MPETPIAVAMSGGVDSSTVAALLVREGRSVVGLTMQLWDQRRLPELAPDGHGSSGRCCSLDDVYDARRVAEQIGIPYYVVNFEQDFETHVVRPFVAEYLAGRTPVPCTLCNNYVKFDRFLDLADSVGAQQIATGHYARVRYYQNSARYQLLRAVDTSKDQSYFLFGLTQKQLARVLFPLGEMTKPEVRELAASLQLPVAAKDDSQEICFVPNGDYAGFLEAYLHEQGETPPPNRGAILTANGRTLGEHQGVHHFTVGQRRGLGVATGEALYVISTDARSQRVVVGGNDALFRQSFIVREVNWISIDGALAPVRAQVRIRNKHTAAPAWIRPDADGQQVEVVFDEPQRAVTPGQGAVFYQDDLVLGGGWIE
jgi:tRNA-specific 2-thiouridylase